MNIKEKIITCIKKDKLVKFISNLILSMIFFLTAYGYLRGRGAWLLILSIMILPSYAFADFTRRYFINYVQKNKSNMREIYLNFILCLLLAMFTYISLIKKPYGSGTLALIANVGYVLCLFILVFILKDKIRSIKIKKVDTDIKLWEIPLLMIFPLLIGGISLLGVYPGAMSADSVIIWHSIVNNTYNNTHPLLYVLLLKGLSLIWDSPAVVAIFQILLTSFTYSYIAYRLIEFGLHRIIAYILVIILTILPANLMLSIIIWKDIPYSMALLLLSVEIFRIFSNKDYFSRTRNIITLTLLSFFIISMRHNGLYVIVGVYLVLTLYLLIIKKMNFLVRSIIVLTASIILYTSIFNFSILMLGDKYKKESNFTSTAIFAIPVHGLVTVYNTNLDSLTDHQRERLYNYLNIEGVKEHTLKYNNNYWMFQGSAKVTANSEAINKDKTGFLLTYLEMLKEYPKTIIGSYMRSTAIAWSSVEYGFTSTYVVDIYQFEDETISRVEQNVLSPKVNTYLRETGKTVYQFITNLLYWRPAFAMLLIMLFILSSSKKITSLIIALPVVLNHLSYFASCEGQCTRYMYANYSFLFFLLFYVMLSHNSSKKELNNK